MPAERRHRGQHPGDDGRFAPCTHGTLAAAVTDLSWLLTRGYHDTSALKLVGDRYALDQRQRQAVSRCAGAEQALAMRRAREVALDALAGRPVALDGFNCLITLETALSGGLILVGADGCARDLSSIHGTYRAVCETPRAVELLGELLATARAERATWYLDRPVSNSGRLKALIEDIARREGWPWEVELSYNPDRELADGQPVVASSDGWVLDRCAAWVNLVGPLVAQQRPEAWRLVLRPAEERR